MSKTSWLPKIFLILSISIAGLAGCDLPPEQALAANEAETPELLPDLLVGLSGTRVEVWQEGLAAVHLPEPSEVSISVGALPDREGMTTVAVATDRLPGRDGAVEIATGLLPGREGAVAIATGLLPGGARSAQASACSVIKCAPGTTCDGSTGVAECLPAQCEPAACGPALELPLRLCADGESYSGPSGSCIETAHGCAWEILTCP